MAKRVKKIFRVIDMYDEIRVTTYNRWKWDVLAEFDSFIDAVNYVDELKAQQKQRGDLSKTRLS